MSTKPNPKTQTKSSFVGTASVVMLAFALSRASGLVREALLSSAFGASYDLDAFRAALRVPDTLYTLVAGGALASAFIPTFTAYLARGEHRTAWQIASAVTNLVFGITLIVSLLTALIAPWLVPLALAPGYDGPTQALIVDLLRWMLASTVIFGVSGLLMGILNANDRFLLPALAPTMYNLGICGGVLFFHGQWGIHSAALGTVAGALLHLLVQLPALRNLNWRYRAILGLRLEGVREVARLMGPRVLGLAITQLNFWVNTNLGSRIPVEGVVTALNLGWYLMLLPQGIFAQAVAIVLLPSFSAQAAREERGAIRSMLRSAIQVLVYLTLPSTIGLIVLGRPLVELFLMRGAFDTRAVAMVAWALAWYAVGLIAHSALEVVTRAFYAMHDTATPVWVGGGAMALNVALSLLFRWLFEWVGARSPTLYQPWMPLGGLALANSVATILETLTLTWLVRQRLDGLEGRLLWASLWRTTIGAAIMCGALLAYARWMPVRSAWILGGGGIALGVGTFGLSTLLLRSPELELILTAVRRRLGR
jgi:putative peptidoglycan lipid II flippase